MSRQIVVPCSSLVVLGLLAGGLVRAGDPPGANRYCPVMPANLAEAQWSTVYKGARVYFCCNNCLDSFRKSPQAFEANISQVAHSSASRAHDRSGTEEAMASTSSNTLGTMDHNWNKFEIDHPTEIVLMVLIVGSVLFASWQLPKRWLRRRFPDGVAIRPVYGEWTVFVLVALVFQLTLSRQRLEGEVLKSHVLRTVHHATYYDHGYPPVPQRPQAPKRLAATFYRGNDERSEFLFNGGDYLTAEFDIALERPDATAIQYGDVVADVPLWIRLTIRRAPNSPDRLFAPTIMDRIYLTKQYEPLMGWKASVADRTRIQAVEGEPGVWQARYPLGVIARADGPRIDPETATRDQLLEIRGVTPQIASWFLAYRDAGYPIRGAHDLAQAGIEGEVQGMIVAAFGSVSSKGIVYLCEANYVGKRQMGARFHYAIQYDLLVRDGRIQPDSDLWMGFLSRSQKAAKRAIPDNEWFSVDPLPVVPRPQELGDELLGIDDYPDL